MTNFLNALFVGLANLLEREAGYSIISLFLILGGVLLIDGAQARGQVAHDLVVFGLGVLSRSMGSKKPA